MTDDDLIAELEHLTAFRVWPDEIAARLGQDRQKLIKHLSYLGRPDLIDALRIEAIPPKCRADKPHWPCRMWPGTDGYCRGHRPKVGA